MAMNAASHLEIKDSELEVPTNFSFPFQPYQIQIDFMTALFKALDTGRLGIFESPTGTGKSLSLLCGSLTWLLEREKQRIKDLKSLIHGCNLEREEKLAKEAVNWIVAQHEFRQKKEKIMKATRELKFHEKTIEQRNLNLQKRKQQQPFGSDFRKRSAKPSIDKDGHENKDPAADDEDDLTASLLNDEFAPEPYSDGEFSEGEEEEESEPEFHPFKVIFASRTHSQLAQFVNELKRTEFKVTSASLGSRKNLCVNPDLTRLKSLSLMNERCLDLQKSSKGKKTKEAKKQKTCSGCPYFNQVGISNLKRQILSEPMDIEELVEAGTKTTSCPYYASRKASKEAQLIMLPYNTILHSGTREGIGLQTQNSVVILDEAHNIVEGISNMYSSHVTLAQLHDSLKGLKVYMNRYITRFHPKNLLNLEQIIQILESFITILSGENVQSRVFYVQEFISAAGVQTFDFYQLLKYMIHSKLIFKLKGYLYLQEKSTSLKEVSNTSKIAVDELSQKPSSPGQAVLNFLEFIKCITKSGGSGRIIQDGQILKFLLLDTTQKFSELVHSARSIILAGGTMSPYEDVEEQLFYGSKDRIAHFACDHVIPDDNLVCLAVSHGPSLTKFDFTHKNRNSSQLLQELCVSVLNISKVVPGGLVIFLVSYEFEKTFYAHLVESGILQRIETKKKVFREPKDSSIDKVLNDYSRQIRNSTGGAVLLAVIGGKLSEGINFADDLGRCVVVVGLPYPNITSIEIKQKIQFISEKFGPEPAKQLLPNACFKAVNQSIGRAIRHSQDFAAIILLDFRFLLPESQAQLPNWIKKKYATCSNFGKCFGTVSKFFSAKRIGNYYSEELIS